MNNLMTEYMPRHTGPRSQHVHKKIGGHSKNMCNIVKADLQVKNDQENVILIIISFNIVLKSTCVLSALLKFLQLKSVLN